MGEQTRRALAGALTASLVLLASACGSDPVDFGGKVLDKPYVVPTTPLTDTSGEDYSLADSTDKRLTLVFFGYSNCPDICQTVMAHLTSAMTRLDDADRDDLDVVFVTTDPARDDESTLRRYLDGYDKSFIGLTGDLQTIIDVGRPLAVYVSDGTELPTGGYDLGGHTTTILGVDSDDQVPVYWNDDTTSAQFAADIHTLLEDS